jgi:glycine cleavage system T protein (aminomethyltransferase)
LSPVETTPAVRKTALNAVHRQLGAKMVDFNGWDMPVEYSGIIAEHNAVRTGVGIFDVSHMGDIRVAGREALASIQHISINDASRLAIGQAQYSAMLYPQGTFVDDIIVHRLAEQEYLIVINAGTREKDFNWVRDNTRQFDCVVENLSDDFTQIAIQGPRGVDVVQKLTDADLSAVKFYWVTRGTICGLKNILIARTGYTGEDGFELIVPGAHVERLWQALRDAGVAPCGLGARDTLRLEAGMNLYGQDMDEAVSPLESGLAWTVDLATPRDFVGKRALAAHPPARQLVGLVLKETGGVLRAHQSVHTAHGDGEITSGTFSPTMKASIALARVPGGVTAGDVVHVQVRDRRLAARVVKPPFVRNGKVRVPGL